LRLLFCNRVLAELESYFGQTIRAIEFSRAPQQYFRRTTEGENEPYQIAFASLPSQPFTEPGKIGYVSRFVKHRLTTAFLRLQNKEEYNAIRKAGTFVHNLLGFALKRLSVRGFIFEDLCYDRICSEPPMRYHFELSFRDGSKRRIEIPHIAGLDSGDLKTIPDDSKCAWLWASNNPTNSGFSAIFYSVDTMCVLQITRSVNHTEIDLDLISDHVLRWMDHKRECYFVVLTDSQAHLDTILHSELLLRGIAAYQDPHSCVGLLVNDANGQPVALNFPDSIDLDQYEPDSDEESLD
jgi:hypothetical protein